MEAPVPEPRQFYPIREASRLTQVAPHTLRYWEKRLQLLRPTRINGGQRRYSRGDLDTIVKVRDLLAGRRLTLEGAKKALAPARSRPGAPAPESGAARALLAGVRQELDAILADMDRHAKDL